MLCSQNCSKSWRGWTESEKGRKIEKDRRTVEVKDWGEEKTAVRDHYEQFLSEFYKQRPKCKHIHYCPFKESDQKNPDKHRKYNEF